MTGFAKFLVGAAATSLLAWGAHALTGEDYIGGLREGAIGALGDAGGLESVSIAMQDDPLARIAVLSGTDDPATRAAAEAAVLGVRGISAVRWVGSDLASVPAPVPAPATTDLVEPSAADAAQAVASCQSDLDAVMAGKVINFASGSASIAPASLTIVDEVSAALSACDGMNISVAGHTDATGTNDVNQRLSKARADSVAAALAERGIAAERVSATGFGSSQPVMEGTSAAANAANRRIAFTLGSTTPTASVEGE